MIRKVLLLVEGQTEERFVKDLLAPAVEGLCLALVPTIVTTKHVPGFAAKKGGHVTYAKFARQVRRLLGDTSAAMVTTLLDYYGLPDDFPGRATPVGTSALERVRHVEQGMKDDIGERRYEPFLFLHEFEALLFVAPEEIARTTQVAAAEGALRAAREAFPSSPEDINDSPITAPSKRIEAACGRAYQKTVHGPTVAKRIGLAAILKDCAHFDSWLQRLERL